MWTTRSDTDHKVSALLALPHSATKYSGFQELGGNPKVGHMEIKK